VSLSYKDDDQFKQDAVAEFAKADTTIHGLIATDILTKGFDVSDVMIGVSARPFSKSLSSHIQQIGRVMRSHPGKDFALWLDHSGNYLRFRDDWDDVYENGVSDLDDGKEKTKKEPTEQEKKDAKCPKCSHLWPSSSDTCPCCGHVRERRNIVSAVPGEMEELGASAGVKIEQKRQWYGQLLSICEASGYQPGWAANKYREKFGSWPNGLAKTPIDPTPEVSKWVIASRIRWAKSKKKEQRAAA
jgi:superfamily II DNA or RNA helicase